MSLRNCVLADLGTAGQSFAGVAPDGIAVNTALSESYITGLAVRGTEKGFYFNQPNGVVHLTECFLYASSQDWPGDPASAPLLPGYDWNLACPLELHDSFSIQATSCDLELNQYGEWAKGGGGLRIANVTGAGKLSMKDICVEMQGSFHIGGAAMVSWDGNDDGYSSSPFPTFEIGEDATGSLLVSNAAWVRPTWWGINMVSTGSDAPLWQLPCCDCCLPLFQPSAWSVSHLLDVVAALRFHYKIDYAESS